MEISLNLREWNVSNLSNSPSRPYLVKNKLLKKRKDSEENLSLLKDVLSDAKMGLKLFWWKEIPPPLHTHIRVRCHHFIPALLPDPPFCFCSLETKIKQTKLKKKCTHTFANQSRTCQLLKYLRLSFFLLLLFFYIYFLAVFILLIFLFNFIVKIFHDIFCSFFNVFFVSFLDIFSPVEIRTLPSVFVFLLFFFSPS